MDQSQPPVRCKKCGLTVQQDHDCVEELIKDRDRLMIFLDFIIGVTAEKLWCDECCSAHTNAMMARSGFYMTVDDDEDGG